RCRRRDADRDDGGARGRQHGRSRQRPDQAVGDRRNRQAIADDARRADHLLDRQRRRQVLRDHPGDVPRLLSAAGRAQHHVFGNAAERDPVSDHLQRADHHRADPAVAEGRAIRAAERGQRFAPQPADLRHRRHHHPVPRHQTDRPRGQRAGSRLRFSTMLNQIRPAIVLIVLMTVLTGLAYPLAMTGLAQVLFPHQASGSLIEKDRKVIGSELIGQNFTDAKYFQGRPSAKTDTDPNDSTKTVPAPYNAGNSGGSNAGPTSKALIERVQGDVETLKKEKGGPLPVDMVTSSASGLDPHVTPATAELQVPRVAKARGLSEDKVRQLVAENTQGCVLGLLAEARVNVLQLNLALDALK